MIMKKNPTSKPLSARQIAFARYVAEGMPASRAYMSAGYAAQGNAAEVNGSKLLRNAQVQAEIMKLQADASAKADMTRDELVSFLAKAIRTPIGEIDETSPLAQEVSRDFIEKKGGPEVIRVKVKSVGKLEAAKQLIAICGWAAPEKHEHSGTVSLAGILASIDETIIPKKS